MGEAVGASVGEAVGASVGEAVGASVGEAVGASVGEAVGASVGEACSVVCACMRVCVGCVVWLRLSECVCALHYGCVALRMCVVVMRMVFVRADVHGACVS